MSSLRGMASGRLSTEPCVIVKGVPTDRDLLMTRRIGPNQSAIVSIIGRHQVASSVDQSGRLSACRQCEAQAHESSNDDDLCFLNHCSTFDPLRCSRARFLPLVIDRGDKVGAPIKECESWRIIANALRCMRCRSFSLVKDLNINGGLSRQLQLTACWL
jgi:hypothetical protein